ncbi:MAG: acyltransferase family protein [Amaricoccus sp.]
MSAYRPEIDGLRAVAVVPVVLYHAHIAGMSGGFVGVDVFFVISGFLITGILASDLAAGRFSIVTFYERRVRRIFPALFAMLAVACLLALWLLLPFELEDFSRSLVAAALFVSNLHFMGDTGYFAAAAASKPLLHTWSLAVEEQFYIFFPLWLYLLGRFAPRWLLPLTATAFVLSLALCIERTHPQDDQAFFYTPTRVWELLAGSLLALAPRRTPLPPLLAEGLAAAGLALIAVAVFGFDARTPFPGSAALFPVIGTALVILACTANRTRAGAGLSLGPVRFFGLISYSLYLWHWPLLVFHRFWRVAPPPRWETALVVVASVALATVSWHFVERPFRTRVVAARRGPLFAAGGAAMAASVAFGAWVIGAQGLPGRVPPELLALAAIRSDEVGFTECDSLPGGRPCVIGPGGTGDARFVVWGDSHAGALMPAFQAAARDAGMTGLYLGAAGCVPLLGVDQYKWSFRTCADGSDAVLAAIAARPEVGTVILVSRWAFYAMGERFRAEGGPPVFIQDGDSRRASLAENARVFERGFARTVEALSRLGRRVVVVTQVPENEFDLPQAMARAGWLGRPVAFGPTRGDFEARQTVPNGLFRAAESVGAVTVLDLGDALCPADRCPVERDGLPLYRDSNHLTAAYAAALAPLLAPALPSSER